MRRLPAVAFAVAVTTSAFAQLTYDRDIHVELADGRDVAVPLGAQETTGGYIVEFVAPPAAIASQLAGKATIDYAANLKRFRADLTAIAQHRAGKAAIEQPEIRREYFVAFHGAAIANVTADDVAQLRLLPYVRRIAADRVMHAYAAQPSANITKIGADKFWSAHASRGSGVTVAVIDTGIDYMHEALGGGIGAGFKVIGGHDFVNNDDDPMDDAGHGTHVAGIIAGDSNTIVGVAPDVKLIAYKVLGANGSGKESDVIAAIERAADPNGDGNTSDHVDIANMSLGSSGGNPDDESCVAVDNATAAGVTFAIASGNAGGFHRIGSPGTARSAITVGAVDSADRIASFSSRGPTTKSMTIKPDVVAPGVTIVSSFPGNRYAALSGTSMASPHVAGAAALLKAIHRDWTPQQIKLALMNNATIIQEDVMSQGAGRIDVAAAASGNLQIEPPIISLGLARSVPATWTASQKLHVTNRGSKTATYSVLGAKLPSATSVPSASSITLSPGASADVDVDFTIDNSAAFGAALSYTVGGGIVFTNTSLASDTRAIPWATTKAFLTTVTFDRAYPDALWLNDARTSTLTAQAIDDHAAEILTLAGKWDMYIYTPELDGGGKLQTIDFIAREGFLISDHSTIALTAADVPHAITLAGRREDGQPLNGSGYASTGRILLGGTGTTSSLGLPWSSTRTMHFSDLSKTVLLYETMLDPQSGSYYMIQHPALEGVTADASLKTGGADLRGGTVQLGVPPATRGDRRINIIAAPLSGSAAALQSIVDSSTVTSRVYVSPDTNKAYSYGIGFSVTTDGAVQYSTPLLRVVNDHLIAAGTGSTFLPWAYSGSNYEFGLGPQFPVALYVPTGTLRLGITSEMMGPLGEARTADRPNTSISFDAGKGAILTAGTVASYDVTAKQPFHIETVNKGFLVPGVVRTATMSMDMDSSRTDFFPPTLTSLRLVDGSGTIVSRLAPHGNGVLLFSAADFTANANNSARQYNSINSAATKLSYRYAGESAWRPLSVTEMEEDSTTFAGTLYRADLAAVTNAAGFVELRFDLADPAGNTSVVTLAPAFSVGPETSPRHRAAR